MTVSAHMLLVEPFLPLRFQLARAVHEKLLVFNKLLPRKTPIRGVESGIHPDGVARTGLDTKAAVDAAQGVDLVTHGELFNWVIRIFTSFNINTFRWTGRGAKKTGGTLHRPIPLEGQTVASPEGVRIRPSLVGVLNGNGRFELFGQTQLMQAMDQEIAPKVVACDHKTTQDLREIRSFPESHLFDPLHPDLKPQ